MRLLRTTSVMTSETARVARNWRRSAFQCAAAAVMALVSACDAQAQEFQWLDAQGQQRRARKADDVPRADWRNASIDVKGTEATSGERFRTAEGLTVVIEGIQAPSLDEDGTAVSAG